MRALGTKPDALDAAEKKIWESISKLSCGYDPNQAFEQPEREYDSSIKGQNNWFLLGKHPLYIPLRSEHMTAMNR
jgi:hypothetical protein